MARDVIINENVKGHVEDSLPPLAIVGPNIDATQTPGPTIEEQVAEPQVPKTKNPRAPIPCDAYETRSRQVTAGQEANVALLLLAATDPLTLNEALASVDRKEWEAAMAEELDSLAKNETWDLERLPPNRKAIRNK